MFNNNLSAAARCILVPAAVLLLACSALAQQPSTKPASTAPQTTQVFPSYEGQKVSSVEIAGRPDLDTTALQGHISLKPGDAFSRSKADQSVAELKSIGHFQDVQLDVVPDISGVRVLLILQPGMYFGIYSFPGAIPRFSYSRLLQVSSYPPEGPYTTADVKNAAAALETFFQRSGYFLAKVTPELITDKAHGLVSVAFRTELGKRAKFGNVTIEGATPEQTAELQKRTRSTMARLRGAAIRPGRTYKLRTLQNATQYLTNSLVKKDFLDAQVKLIGATFDPETNRADVTFHVDAGPVIRVKIEGASVRGGTRRKLLPIYQQLGADPGLINEGSQNLVSHFQSKGYFQVQVRADVQQHSRDQTIVYTISKGPKHKVTGVHIRGNHQISDDELEPSVTVERAHFLSHGNYSDKLVRASVKNLESIYRAAGFSSVKVTPQVRHSGGDVEVSFVVDEGPRDVVGSLRIEGNETLPQEQFAPNGLNLTPGQPYSQKLADQDRTQIMARYLDHGYLTATFRETVEATASNPHLIVVTYHIHEGPQVQTSRVITIGRKHTTQEFIDRTARLRSRGPISADQMLTSESRLYTPGIFDWAEVDLRRQITTQTSEDIVIKVHEARRNSLTYGVGFQVINRGGSVPGGTVAVPGLPPIGLPNNFKTSEKTFWGPRGSIEYTLHNLRGKAETLTFGGLAEQLLQRASITYQNPSFRYSSWTSTLSLTGQHDSENPIFTSLQGGLGFQLQKPLDAKKVRNVLLRYSLGVTELSDLLIPDLVPPQDRHVRLSTLSASYTRDTRDSPLDAHKGIYQSLELSLNARALGSSANFVRAMGQMSHFKTFPTGIVWANNLRLGLEQQYNGSFVPLSELFFSGGGSTLRGFPLNGAGPQRTITACGDPADISTCGPITVPVGGQQLLIFNSEFRVPVPFPLPLIHKGLGVVAFYDGGNVFPQIGWHGQYTNSIGGGIRYTTPVGPLRIDIGHNLNAPPGIKSTQLFITLGQAF